MRHGHRNRQTKLRSLGDAHNEMIRSVELWGEQNHPDWTNSGAHLDIAPVAKYWTERKAELGTVSWADILLEEVAEAMDEAEGGHVENLRTELIRVAAVALNWVEAIDRRKLPPPTGEPVEVLAWATPR